MSYIQTSAPSSARRGARPAMAVPRVSQEFFPLVTGPVNQALAIARGLEARGISSPIFTTVPRGAEAEPPGVAVRRFRPVLSVPNVRLAPGLWLALQATPMTVLHLHNWRNPSCDGALLAALGRGVPVVAQAHGVANGFRYVEEPAAVQALRRSYEALARPLITARATVVVASTYAEADELHGYGFPRSRITIIPVGVERRFFAAEGGGGAGQAGPLTLLTVGRLSQLRNLEQMIGAVARLRSWAYEVRLRVVGPEVALVAGEPAGYVRRLEALAHRLGVADRVVFEGPLYGERLVAAYSAADIFVCTTRHENFGQPIAEAAAVGLPIVATPAGVAPDLLGDGSAGFLVPLDDVEATAEALRQLCVSEPLRRAMGAAARAYAARSFDWEQIVPRYVSLYEALAAA